jgi:hypothetical protein
MKPVLRSLVREEEAAGVPGAEGGTDRFHAGFTIV